MPTHIAIYKRYDTNNGLQQGKDYKIISNPSKDGKIMVTVGSKKDSAATRLVYTNQEELLMDWHILRTWKGK